MGATNSTLNYHLSQFISTDKPAWLQDYNGDMEKIDAGINTAKVAADAAQNTANSAVSSIGTVSSDITALQTDVVAHTNDITDLQGDVNTIESLIGNGTPTAGDHTLIGAINTNTADIAALNTNYIPLPDFNRVITTLSTTAAGGYNLTYTATQDCYLNGKIQARSGVGGGAVNLIDATNNIIARLGGCDTADADKSVSAYVNIFLKAGWRVTIGDVGTNMLTVFAVR